LQDANPTIRRYATPSPPIPTAPPSLAAGLDICLEERTLLIRTLFHRDIHPGNNAAAVTPHEPKFTKMGEDLSWPTRVQNFTPLFFPLLRNP